MKNPSSQGSVSYIAKLISRIRLTSAIVGVGIEKIKRELSRTRLGSAPPVRLVIRVIQEIGEDDGTHMAASVSYYAILSLFPLALGLSALVGHFAGSLERQREVVDFVVDFLPGSEGFVRESVTGMSRFKEVLGLSSLVGLFWTGSAVFGSISRAVNRAWDVRHHPPFYKNKPRQLTMAVGVGILFLISTGLSSVLQWAASIHMGDQTIAEILGGTATALVLRLPTFAITLGIFLAIYKYLPNTKTYWGDVWLGAVIAGVLFELTKSAFIWYLNTIASYYQIYGSVASIIVLMVWTYISALILIVGAEFASEYGRMKRGKQRGEDATSS